MMLFDEGQVTLFDLIGEELPASEEKLKKKPVEKPKETAEPQITATTTAQEWARSVRESNPVKKNPVQEKFLKEWDQRTIEDWGVEKSEQFKKFARAFKKYLCSVNEDMELNWYTVGHYDISASVNLYGQDFYISYSVPRGGEIALDFVICSCMKGVLVRTQKEPKDYRGGNNNFCSVRALPLYLNNWAKDERNRRLALAQSDANASAAA